MTNPHCRFCEKELSYRILDLGYQPSANGLLDTRSLNNVAFGKNEPSRELSVWLCQNCALVQLGNFEAPEKLFTENYYYYSSQSKSWTEHARIFVEEAIQNQKLDETSLVIEVGSNDGYLLQHFVDKNIPCLGIDPAGEAAAKAEKKGVNTLIAFFSSKTALEIIQKKGKPDLIILNNVFAHMPDVRETLRALKACMSDETVVSIQVPHLARLIEENQFDTVYDEHYFYFSAIALTNLFSDFSLKIFRVEDTPFHGGSIRISVCKASSQRHKDDGTLMSLVQWEKKLKIDQPEGFQSFQQKVEKIKIEAVNFIKNRKLSGKKIAAYGAAAKGNTFINFCGLTSEDILFVADDTPVKQGKFLPGSHIPIVSPETIIEEKPDIIIVLPWNFSEEIFEKICNYSCSKAEIVTFIPFLNSTRLLPRSRDDTTNN